MYQFRQNNFLKGYQRMSCATLRAIRRCFFTSFLLVGALAAATSVGQVLRTFDFQGLGSSPSGPNTATTANAISDDGRVIVGRGQLGQYYRDALRWTSDTGWEAIIPDAYGNNVYDVSADGSVIVGVHAHPTNGNQAFRWTESTGTAQFLGSLPGGNGTSFATAVSRDGSIVGGGSRGQGFLWDGQMTPLEISPQGLNQWVADVTVAPNGDVWSIGKAHNDYEVLIWKNDQLLFNYIPVWRASGDAITYTEEGVVAVASFAYSHLGWNAYRMSGLNESTMQFDEQKILAPAGGGVQTRTTDISTNGRLIVGHNFSGPGDWAVVWEESGQMIWGPFDNASTEQIGGRRVKDILLENLSSQRQSELNFANWNLRYANGVTMFRDGDTVKSIIVGDGINPAGRPEAWRAEVNVQNPTVYVDVDPKSTYLRTADEPPPGETGEPLDARAIPLATVLGVPIVPGDLLYLQRVGNFKFNIGPPVPGLEGPHGDGTLRNLWGVFSSSDELLTDDPDPDVKTEPVFPISRFELEEGVTSAIVPTDGTFQLIETVADPIQGSEPQPTNINEDFVIGSDADPLENPPGVHVRVPEGATHLFVGAGDVQWFDNSLTEDIDKFGLNITLVTEPLAGDYNGNGTVDAADYVVWRNTRGSTTNLSADGNGNNVVDSGDYTAWRARFGQSAGSGALAGDVAAPEPASVVLLTVGLFGLLFPFCQRKRSQ